MKYEVRHTRKKILRFIKKHRFALLIAVAAAVVVLLLVFVILPGGDAATPEAEIPDNYDTPVEEIDAETLAGLSGEGSALGTQEETGEIKIGVTLQEMTGKNSGLLAGLESAAAADIKSGAIEDFEVRDANGSQNQQIQDVYTMINKGYSVIVVAGADTYNFEKITEICANNNVQVVAYDVDAASGFAVNVVDKSDASADFAQFIKDAGLSATSVLKGTEQQIETVQSIVNVDKQFTEMWDAVYDIGVSIENEDPLQSIIVFDYNSNDVLRAWLRQDTTPKAMAGVATVAFVKTWYELLNGGVEIQIGEVDEESDEEPETKTVSATAADFSAYAMTSIENVGDVLYEFAKRLAEGGSLPEANYVYEVEGYDGITSSNIAQYYEKVKDRDSGLVYSTVDLGDIDALFAQGAQQ